MEALSNITLGASSAIDLIPAAFLHDSSESRNAIPAPPTHCFVPQCDAGTG